MSSNFELSKSGEFTMTYEIETQEGQVSGCREVCGEEAYGLAEDIKAWEQEFRPDMSEMEEGK